MSLFDVVKTSINDLTINFLSEKKLIITKTSYRSTRQTEMCLGLINTLMLRNFSNTYLLSKYSNNIKLLNLSNELKSDEKKPEALPV